MQVSYDCRIFQETIITSLLLICLVGADFTLTTSTVMFTSGNTGGDTLCFAISLSEDLILENDELFTVSISDFGGAGQGAITSAPVTIDDNDGSLLCFETTHYGEQQINHLSHQE